MNAAPGGPHHAWEVELDRLESDVTATEELLTRLTGTTPTDETDPAATAPAWTAPTGLGTLPAELLPRAEALLVRQQQVTELLRTAQSATTRQRDFAARVTGATATRATPAYLDVNA